ncbi:VacJ family lipoprotein [Alphaproteobacteria bacterium]|nr:VacJ family lipoprotein [Alphaproteobacteria bacterium]
MKSIFLKIRSLTIKALILFLILNFTSNNAFAEKIKDPFEKVNRAVFIFNDAIDTVLLEPLSKVYLIVPQEGRDVLRNFMRNLETPIILANNILQADISAAQVTSMRFIINSTVGIAGFFDPAKKIGLERKDEDFGQTLAKYGIGSGYYLVLPFMGPTTIRDAFGIGVDQIFDPTKLVFKSYSAGLAKTSIRVLDVRGRHIKTIDTIKSTSIDYYSTLKSLYIQRRMSEVSNGKIPNLPDFDYNENEDSLDKMIILKKDK